MKMKSVVIFVALLMGSVRSNEMESLNAAELENLMQNNSLAPATMGLILDTIGEQALRNFLNQMPCGWPEYGVPPLAPYINKDLKMHLTRSVLDAFIQLLSFRFDGLNHMQINDLNIQHIFTRKVKFNFNFRKLKTTACNLNIDALVNMDKLGFLMRYEGSNTLDFVLENLSVKGQFYYKAPPLYGSIEIYKFEVIVTLGSARSNIGGILGNGKLNAMINNQIENMLPALINQNQDEINALVEQNFVPRFNAIMKGKNMWELLQMLANSTRKCNPGTIPW